MAKPARTARPDSSKAAASRTRRSRPLWLWLGAAAVLVALIAWWALRPGGPGAIVLISIDTLRADRLPAYGYTQGRTPKLDEFARAAVTFERAYAHAPQTLPSHASMFTGLLPFEHKVRDNLGFTLAAGAQTMASMLARAGYRTAGFASAYVLRPETGISRGFDLYDANLPPAGADQPLAQVLRPGPTTLAATKAWLDAQTDARFFLFFHIYEPHAPYSPPARYAQQDPYDGEVSYSDEIVGELLTTLRDRGWYDEATIVLTADHGEGLGDHVEREHGLFVYEETIRVPLIVKMPGSRRGGSRVTDLVQHIDLLPTVAALTGTPAATTWRGRNLQPLLTASGQITPQGIYAEALYPRYHFGWSELTALVDGRYKYIQAPRPELYDLERDPKERQNIFAERTQAAAALQAGLRSLAADRPLDAPATVTAEERERLAALGYVGTRTPESASESGTALPDPKDKVGALTKYREAIERVAARDYDTGIRLIREVLSDNPDMLDAWLHLAQINLRRGRLDEAYAAYREVIQRKPDESGALLGASSTLLSMKRFDEATQHAELAIKTAPAAAHQQLASIAVAQNRPDVAVRHADLAARADPTLPAPLLVRGMIEYNRQRYVEALPYFMKARDAYANRTMQAHDLHFYIGDSLARLGRNQEAEPFFRQELRLYPQNIRARAGLAMLYQAAGRRADAEHALGDMLRVSPTLESYEQAAALWTMFGRPDRAAAVRAEARKRFGR